MNKYLITITEAKKGIPRIGILGIIIKTISENIEGHKAGEVMEEKGRSRFYMFADDKKKVLRIIRKRIPREWYIKNNN